MDQFGEIPGRGIYFTEFSQDEKYVMKNVLVNQFMDYIGWGYSPCKKKIIAEVKMRGNCRLIEMNLQLVDSDQFLTDLESEYSSEVNEDVLYDLIQIFSANYIYKPRE